MTESTDTMRKGVVHAQSKPIPLTGFKLSRWNLDEISDWLDQYGMHLRKISGMHDRPLFKLESKPGETFRNSTWGVVEIGEWILRDEDNHFQVIASRAFEQLFDIVDIDEKEEV